MLTAHGAVLCLVACVLAPGAFAEHRPPPPRSHPLAVPLILPGSVRLNAMLHQAAAALVRSDIATPAINACGLTPQA